MDMSWLVVGGGAVAVGLLHLRGLMQRGRFLPAYRRREVREALAEVRGALVEGCRRPVEAGGLRVLGKGLLGELESGLPLRGLGEWQAWQERLRAAFLASVGGPLEYDFTRALRAAEDVESALARVVPSYP